MASDLKTAYGSLAAVNATVGPITYANGFVSLCLGGTFVGTVQVVASSNLAASGDVPIIPLGATSASLTVPGLYYFPRIAGDFSYSVVMTAFTSGAAEAVLSCCPSF